MGGTALVVGLFSVFVLPYLLPLAGPEPVDPRSLADPDGAFVEVSGMQLYFVHAAGSGETVLLIHGQGGSTLSWKETLPALQRAGYDVYALDLPGAGLSEKGLALDYSHPALAETIVAFMDRQGIDRAHLVAHAFSGNIAVQVALAHPERVGKLALVAPTIITEPTPEIPPLLFDLGFLERWTRVMLHLVLPEAVGEQLRSAAKVDEVVDDALIADYSRFLRTPDWDLSIIGMLRDSHRNALTKPLSEVESPVLLLWGARDGWAPPGRADELKIEFRIVMLVELEGIGHLPMHETPHSFNTTLINFLGNQTITQPKSHHPTAPSR
jgi:pimeloyl-ACP methyl ester carboxylesterase